MGNLLQNIFESILFFILILGLNYFVYYGVLFHFGVYWPYILLISALVLFLLDIVVRKFNFKWPHEWFHKKNKKELSKE